MSDELHADPDDEVSSDRQTLVTASRAEGGNPVPSTQKSATPEERPIPKPFEPTTAKRIRPKMTLRIPDDEVPSSAARLSVPTPIAGVAVSRIITLEGPPKAVPPSQLPAVTPASAPPAGAPAVPAPLHSDKGLPDEDSWTPYQPTVADRKVDSEPPGSVEIPIDDVGRPPSPPARERESFTDIVIDEDATLASPTMSDHGGAAEPAPLVPAASSSGRGRAAALLDPDEIGARGPLAVPSSEPDVSAAGPRAKANTDVSIDVDEVVEPPTPSEPAEVLADDVVAVEAKKPLAPPSVPPMRPRTPSAPSFSPGSTAPRPSRPTIKTIKTQTVPAEPAPAPKPPPPPPRAPPLVIVPTASPLAPPPMGDAAASRKRARPWWEDLFNDDFIRTMAKITDAQVSREVDFIEDSLGVDKGAMVLDLACGTGRHAIELSRRGYEVVGFDLSLAMLAKAADEAQDRNQRLNFVQGDMREMTFDATFDGIYCWNTSFGFFEEEKNAAVVANIHRALKPGGQVLLDVINRDFAARQCPSLVWFEGDGCVCMDEMMIDWITSRMKVKRTMMMDDGRSREIEYSIRVYALHELGKVLHDNGFRVAQVSGMPSSPGVFFGPDSPRVLILAEKK